MKIILIILLIVSLSVAFVSCIDGDNVFYKVTNSLIALLVIINFITYFTMPSAIDVYRGKNTLEVTYKGGVATDSIVIFK